MSEAKTLLGMLFFFGFIAMMFMSISLGTCEEKYAEWGEMELPEEGWLPSLDMVVWMGQRAVATAGLMLDPCSGIGFIAILIMLPLALTIAYLALGVIIPG